MFGKVIPCKTCNRDEYAARAGLSEAERRITFADIETDGRPGAHSMMSAMNEFVQRGRVGFLTVHGSYGNGKSTLLKALVNDCLKNDVDVRYITMTEVMSYAREAFDNEKQGDSDYGRISRLAQVRVLVIDEVDKARVSDYSREVQNYLFDKRYREAGKFGTVLAWNGKFDAVDLPAIRSRLSEFTVVANWDKDMRPLLGGEPKPMPSVEDDSSSVHAEQRRAVFDTGEREHLRRQMRALTNRMS
jgi:chromosomal replication initiation ATPase DnaA